MTRGPVEVVISAADPAVDRALLGAITAQTANVRATIAASSGELRAQLPKAEVLLGWRLPNALLPLATRLKWLQAIGTGVDDLVVSKDILRDVIVTNVRGIFARPIAEYVVAYALAHFQRIRHALSLQQQKQWRQFTPGQFAGKTVGIAGLGSIGSAIAELCTAMGAHVIGLRRSADAAPHVKRLYGADRLRDFLSQCDVLVLALPGTQQTRGFLSLERLAMLKPTAFVINVGRGSTLLAGDLIAALDRGLVAGAAIDVFEQEPLPEESLLWNRADVFVTPHVSGINRPEDVVDPVIENLRRYLAGEPLQNVVDLGRGY